MANPKEVLGQRIYDSVTANDRDRLARDIAEGDTVFTAAILAQNGLMRTYLCQMANGHLGSQQNRQYLADKAILEVAIASDQKAAAKIADAYENLGYQVYAWLRTHGQPTIQVEPNLYFIHKRAGKGRVALMTTVAPLGQQDLVTIHQHDDRRLFPDLMLMVPRIITASVEHSENNEMDNAVKTMDYVSRIGEHAHRFARDMLGLLPGAKP